MSGKVGLEAMGDLCINKTQNMVVNIKRVSGFGVSALLLFVCSSESVEITKGEQFAFLRIWELKKSK